jgi:hypothetical protein
MVTEFAFTAGLKVYVAEAAMSVKVDPFVPPCTLSVCVRVPQPETGNLSTTRLMVVEAPRSTVSHSGKELLTLSQ